MGILEHGHDPSTPSVAVEPTQSLLTAAVALTGADWTYCDVVRVDEARDIAIFLDFDPAAGSTVAQGALSIWVSNEAEEPAAGDDSWFAPVEFEAVTPAVLVGDVPSGADWTKTPEFALRTARGLVVRTEAADNATDEYRLAIPLNVAPYRWLLLAYADLGDTDAPGTFIIKYSRSV